MIVDVHYHLEERMETVDELLLQMEQHGIDRVVLIPTMVDPIQLKRDCCEGWQDDAEGTYEPVAALRTPAVQDNRDPLRQVLCVEDNFPYLRHTGQRERGKNYTSSSRQVLRMDICKPKGSRPLDRDRKVGQSTWVDWSEGSPLLASVCGADAR